MGGRGVLEALCEQWPAARTDSQRAGLRVWLGPCIGPQAFEVGDEVRAAFVAADPDAAAAFVARPVEGKWLADLFLLARRRLVAAGVIRISGGGVCTVSAPQHFYSYRRDGVTGRFASLVWLDTR